MRFLGRSILGVALLALTAGLLALAAGSLRGAMEERAERGPGGRPAAERVVAAQVVAVEPGTIAPVITTFGEVRAARELEVRAPIGGRVVELSPAVVEGGTVREGEVLARLDPADADAALARIRADESSAMAEIADAERAVALAADELAAANAQREIRERALTRARDLVQRGVGTAAQVETEELALSGAEQTVLSRRQAEASAQAALDRARVAAERLAIDRAEAERRVADLTVAAPFGGRLAEVTVTPGALISPNERMARLIDPGSVEVSFRLSAAQFARLGDPEGQPVEAVLDLGVADAVATGRVTRVGAEVGEGRTGRLLFAALEKGTDALKPGDFVTVRLTEPELRGVALIPSGAVGADGMALALGTEDRLEEVPAEVLRRQGDEVIVEARALAGREIVAERSPLLGAGIRIDPLRGAAEIPDAPLTVRLDDERRARLIAFVEGNERMPAEVKGRILATLQEDEVPVETVERIEGRMGG